MAKSVDKIIEGGAKTALRWKEELPSVLTSCGRAFNYSIDKTGDAVWAGVFEKDRPNEAARFKICADEDEAREFCKLIEGAGKLPLCMGRNAASEAAGDDMTGVDTITLPEYGKKLEDVSGSGRMPKSASAPDAATVQAVIDWLMAGDLAGYDHGRAMEEYGNRYWQIVKEALEFDLYDAVVAKLEADGIEGEWREGARKSAQDVDLGELPEDELKKRAIRDNMKAENDAIMMYSAYIDLLPEGDAVRSGLEDIRDEEKAHVGELHKLLVDLDLSEAEAFDEGMAEVGEGDGEKEERMDQGRAASRKTAGQAAALAKIANRASDLARDIANYLEDEYFESEDDVRAFVDDEIDGSLIYTQDVFDYVREYVPDGEIQERLTPMFYERLSDDVYSALGNLEDYVSGGDDEEDRSASRKPMARRKASRLRRKHGNWRKGASVSREKAKVAADFADVGGQRPFYAYYEGQTKDKKATVGVVQQQIGSKPQLIVISENGQVHDFGLMPNMDYAMRQASRFESMGYVEIAAAAPKTTFKTAQSSGGWKEVGDDYWFKDIGNDGSTINVSWAGWTNLPGNLYYDEKGCYAYYSGTLDGRYVDGLEIARVKTVSTSGIPSEEWESMSFDEVIAKYNNPQDGFCQKEPAMMYVAQLADEWLAQNAQSLPSKTASDGWDEDGGVWAKFVDPYSLEVDYDYTTPGKYHWEVIDMSAGGMAGEKVGDGDEETLEDAQGAAARLVGK